MTQLQDRPEPLALPDIRHNMKCCVMLDTIFAFGWTEIMVAMIPLLTFLNATNTQIGLILGATIATIPGLILSPWITRWFRVKKWYLFGTNIPYFLPIGLCGIGVLMYENAGIESALMVQYILVLMLISQFFGGFVGLPHQEYVAACIPMSWRGRFSGFSMSIGGIVAIGSSALGAWILSTFPKPMSFGYLLLIGWFVCQTGYTVCLFARERPTETEKSPPPWGKQMFLALWSDKPFLRVMLISFLFYGIIFQIGTFVTVYGFKVLGMPAAAAAFLAMTANASRMGLLWLIGILVDKHTPKRVLPYFFLITALALVPVILFDASWTVYFFAFFSTLAISGAQSALNPIIYGIPSPENRPGHYTSSNLVTNVAYFIGPVILGMLSDATTFKTVFIGLAIFALLLCPLAKRMLAALSADVKDYS